ncbi:hypothetical protein BHL83_09735 [Limosilactobacillus reuteri]|uniref:1-acyl-sn-glycerol-3-phosphate acyltransferase n=2 Tax=Limosilactobacillus TaxID=2742598 RepID=A0AAE5MQM8_LIMRT|nr:1-acyl-sn-glycerol-3-phosphate acyltransferase [Limosilactobacillus reuteri]MCI6062804.1 1-acyl-sn-glycerol-3-phosphate acyltransferase [Ligilactobacillus salivarius]OTA50236.1 hypothetical protein BHL91_06840 [Limosilactobacillus reuteri]OTA56735.1 hypothetical protein BHL92_07005 [Limosilactobacillus reuteri]OTA81357.1 hypothetical protein BHL83_09735 [Limosilactobacillus reuteri]OTA85746.1 hypothetical protein BHL84_08840 [Limosilactobacillus reuteri]
MKKGKNYFYQTYSDDFINSGNQQYQLPKNYRWLHHGKGWFGLRVLITGIADVIAWLYFHFITRSKVIAGEKIKKYQGKGCFVYGNHTQTQGDALIAFHLLPHRFVNIIATPANLGNFIVGRLLPFAGILPIPTNFHQLNKFTQAVNKQAQSGHAVFIYPEAHVWPFYTKIRPFSRSAFHYPVDTGLASFCITTTYHTRRWSSKPQIVIYVDGPFYPRDGLTKRQQQLDLSRQIAACMKKRAKLNDMEYIHYEKVK